MTPRRAGTGTPETATARLNRLLTMVPWLLARQGVPVAEAAAAFGVTERQLVADLQLLFLCGTPGHLPDDLIEAEWEDGRVYLGNADEIARPLRLTVDEAITLIVGLRSLAAAPGVADAVPRALRKIEGATARLDGVEQALHVTIERSDAHVDAARAALEQGRRLRLRYFVPGRDEVTQRDVDPMRVVNLDGRWYLEGWCHLAEDTRLFRMDRIEDLRVLPEAGIPPRQAVPRDLAAGAYAGSPSDLLVVIDAAPQAAWLAEYYPCESLERRADASVRLTLRVSDPGWVVRLLVRMGGAAVVVEPPEVAQAVRTRAAAALAHYEAPHTPAAPPGRVGD